MAPSTRFPNLREFRARVAFLGQETRAGATMVAPPRREPPPSVPWMWAVLGIAAIAVLIWAALDAGGPPDGGATVARSGTTGPVVPGPAESATRQLETRLARIEEELAALRSNGARTERSVGGLEQRIDLIEEAFGPITGSLGAPADPPAPDRSPAPLLDPAEDARPPSAYDRVIGAARPRFAPTVAWGIDLGGFASLGELKRYWAQLVGENPLLLGSLAPRQVTRVEADGTRSFRLIAGPLADVAASERLCEALRAREIDCTQTVDSGETI